MADGTDDSLSVEVRLELERADREYEEKARKWAQPIRVPLEFVQQGGGAAAPAGPQMTRSFGGLYAPMASGGTGPIGGSPVVGTVHQQVMSAAVQRGGGFGGAFVPGVGPVPTASTNTVYGQAGYASTFGPFGSVQALPGTARALPAPAVPQPGAMPFDVGPAAAYQQTAATRALAVRQGYDPTGGYRPPLITPVAETRALSMRYAAQAAGPGIGGAGTPDSPFRVSATRVSPMGFDDFADDVGGGFGNAAVAAVAAGRATRQGRAPAVPRPRRFFRDLPNPLEGLGGLFAISGAVRVSEGAFGAVNDREMALAQAGGDPFALARAQMDNEFAPSLGRRIPLVGTLGAAIGEYRTGDRAAAERTLGSAALQDRITGGIRDRAYAVRDAGNALGVTRAGMAGATSAEIVAIGQNTAGAEARRQDFIRESGRAEQERLDAANSRLSEARGALGDKVQVRMSSGAVYARDVTFDASGRVNTTFAGAASVIESDYRRLTEFNRAFDEAGSARDALGKVTARGDQIRDLSNANDQAKLRAIVQSQGDAAMQTATSRRLFNVGESQRRSGAGFDARISGIRGEFDPQIDQAETDIARLNRLDRTGYSQAQNEAHAALVRAAEGSRDALRERRDAATGDVEVDRARFRLGTYGSRVAGNLDLAFDPLGAQLTRIQSRFEQDTENGGLGVDENSPEYRRAVLDRDLATRGARQASNLAQITIGNSLGAESRSLGYAADRNELGARAASMAGDAINRIQSIRRQGKEFADEAELARANSLKGFDMLRQDYALSFRGEQIDLANVFAANTRGTGPGAVFDAIEAERKRVLGADAEAGKDPTVPKGETKIASTSISDFATALAKELDSRLAR